MVANGGTLMGMLEYGNAPQQIVRLTLRVMEVELKIPTRVHVEGDEQSGGGGAACTEWVLCVTPVTMLNAAQRATSKKRVMLR